MSIKWQAVVGYEETYEVSNQGKVRSIDRISSSGHKLKGKQLKQCLHSQGYPQVGLCKNGRTKTFLVHRLVLIAFRGPCSEGLECRHLDGQPGNNLIRNLVWGTHSENIFDKISHGNFNPNTVTGKRVRRSDGEIFSSLREASRKTGGACRKGIVKCCEGSQQQTAGYSWEYY